ncbi:hypothetical protein ARALYDRAFT_896880 [Arabidopsis lyrata subsp. lyrata]|uniref:Dolichol-phosphate mannosyltransferase subunit 3 n=1 Tax=Arabidopsis lyrata subsp. lyrata TaxID=81972 RepID=D7L6I0_ARALL|nr:hypothetical protein ARALYDRAFT_896880 [Arabidopsis lyrata subsp. lyrata]
MKHVVKILSLLVAVSTFWLLFCRLQLLLGAIHCWRLPIYFVVSLGCYSLLMVGIGLIQLPTCPKEAVFLQHLIKAKLSYCLVLVLLAVLSVDYVLVCLGAIVILQDMAEAEDFFCAKGKGLAIGFIFVL